MLCVLSVHLLKPMGCVVNQEQVPHVLGHTFPQGPQVNDAGHYNEEDG